MALDNAANGIEAKPPRPLRVVVIGAGFSGTLVAVHVLRQDSSVQVDLVYQRLP